MKKDDLKKLMIDEIEFFLNQVKKNTNPEDFIFYFSALHAAANRVYNIEYDRRMLYLHEVLISVYNALNNAIGAAKAGQRPILMLTDLPDRLTDLIKELRDSVRNDFEGVHDIYERMIEIKYTTSGNGFYLVERGKIELEKKKKVKISK
ncbi:MAG: hypothetical protein HOE30_24070 [Deltaproteobacteria bacterium]|jgi:hypothetical protein|nr:hypothetical protein [Deltaproteobacteria bacterium]MBT4091576.1 hypothetical protein [Deltaproteobacteria bacterium]MBT4264799.1 hypothetical protein [Deltaproteobacteria bacterium]MBT4639767.1 hypothetical protein [Deltaproteobacteria bacterium]MBT6614622.1 hypothetical protein [Deltaproteobacteria bacterium]